MNPSGGYDFEAIGEVGKDFECPICILLIREAAELPCTHVFCKSCLEHWQANPMERNVELLCPSCKTVYQNHQVSGNKFVDKVIKTSLRVKCKESKFGCEWKGTILDYTNHEHKWCSYKSMNCDFVGCEERILRMDQQKHQSECCYRSVQCQHCKSEIQFINLENHYESCTEYIVNCPNEGCSVTKPRKEICDHTQNECHYEVVLCKYESVGCKHKFQRQCTSRHEHEALPEHMDMLLNGVKVTSMELCAVKETLEVNEEKLKKTEEKLQITEESLAATNEKLEKTNVILDKTRRELQQTRDDLVNANEKILQSNKAIEEVKHHDHEIDDFCVRVTKVFYLSNLSSFTAEDTLRNLAKVVCGLVPQKAMKFNMKYEEFVNKPTKWLELKEILDSTITKPSELYSDRFKQVMDTMETNKLYKISDKEIFVKIDITHHMGKQFSSHFYTSDGSDVEKNPGIIHYSNEFVLYANGSIVQLIFCKVASTKGKSFLLSPMENISVQLPNNGMKNDMALNNMLLIKSVLE